MSQLDARALSAQLRTAKDENIRLQQLMLEQDEHVKKEIERYRAKLAEAKHDIDMLIRNERAERAETEITRLEARQKKLEAAAEVLAKVLQTTGPIETEESIQNWCDAKKALAALDGKEPT